MQFTQCNRNSSCNRANAVEQLEAFLCFKKLLLNVPAFSNENLAVEHTQAHMIKGCQWVHAVLKMFADDKTYEKNRANTSVAGEGV